MSDEDDNELDRHPGARRAGGRRPRAAEGDSGGVDLEWSGNGVLVLMLHLDFRAATRTRRVTTSGHGGWRWRCRQADRRETRSWRTAVASSTG
ncbi:hypothetical protein OsI_28607 [Oryza sativa Indica Group]|uniref:Uncharacterized protein n=1 Tax=Oryza sativa subsp. indica TaxID=39946 RepID=A2YTG7_ORYSI|nr:hypothetical protein OsI_28607 [Oryza sativa Indica Group]